VIRLSEKVYKDWMVPSEVDGTPQGDGVGDERKQQ